MLMNYAIRSITRRCLPSLMASQRPYFRSSVLSGGAAAATVIKPEVSASVTTQKELPVQYWNSKVVGFEDTAHSVGIHDGMVKVKWSSGREDLYPFLWMRDNCQCSSCINRFTLSRTLFISDMDPNIAPSSVEVNPEGVQVTWSDGHTSLYPKDFLITYSFSPGSRELRRREQLPERKLWGSEFDIPEHNWKEVLENDSDLLRMLESLVSTGLVLLRGCPYKDETGGRLLAERIAFIRKTNYGEFFSVRVMNSPSNLAFAQNRLALHTDQPYYDSHNLVQVLHCVEQSSQGGRSQFSDAFYSAKLLQQEDPEMYELLSSVPVEYHDIGEHYVPYRLIESHPTLVRNVNGNLVGVCINDGVRSPGIDTDAYTARRVVSGIQNFAKRLIDNSVKYKLTPGDMALFVNHRVLHAREAITMRPGDERYLVGFFIEWSDVKSKLRVLQRKQQ